MVYKLNLNNDRFIQLDDDGFWLSSGELMGEVSPQVLVEAVAENGLEGWVKEDESEISKLKQQLEAKENENRRLNLDAQKWFDMCMDLLHGVTKPEDYK